MAKRSKGRKKGGFNKGYFYRSGRGWYAVDDGRQIALRYEDGEHIKDRDANAEEVKDAYARWRTERPNTIPETNPDDSTTVLDVCLRYLVHAKSNGAAKTHADRADTLFDFCFGLPAEYRNKVGSDPFRDAGRAEPPRLTAARKQELGSLKLHDGFGALVISQLRKHHIAAWLDCHTTWSSSGHRSRIQAVKRAINYAVAEQIITANPIRGYRTPRSRPRVTYITPQQEAILLERASKALSTAIRVCIRTGARPGIEFCNLEARHVIDMTERMEWRFPPTESKTKKLRSIRITNPEIIAIVRYQMKHHAEGPLFRTRQGDPWTRRNLSQRFRFLKYRLQKEGVKFDDDCCIYSWRHTYAKRCLEGYWTGRPCNIETLARLMGNSPQVCRDHYLQWSVLDHEFLWDNA